MFGAIGIFGRQNCRERMRDGGEERRLGAVEREPDGVVDPAPDRVPIQGNEALTMSVVTDPVEGVGVLIQHGGDSDAVFLVGVTDTAAVNILTF